MTLTTLFSPILNLFENNSDEFDLKPLNRKVVLTIGILMAILSAIIITLAWPDQLLSYGLPIVVFASVAKVAIVVGCLGTDHAVAKLIGSRK